MVKSENAKIVIIGGAIAGLAASKIVRENFPNASVVLISPDDKFYFNIASPRLLVEPELVNEAIRDLPAILKKRGQNFKQGLATGVDFEAKRVTLESGEKVGYDYVVLATGSRTSSPMFHMHTSIDETKLALDDMVRNVRASNEIVVVGGGPTGVETAGELAHTYPNKKIVLYTGADQPLPALDAKRGRAATSKLEALNVEVINNAKVGYEQQPDGKYLVTDKTTNGKTRIVGLVIPAMGLLPNTGYMDSKFLDNKGFVVTDEYLRVKGAADAYAFGDLISGGATTSMDIAYSQTGVLTAVLSKDIGNDGNEIKPYIPSAPNTIIVPISKKGGVGVVSGWGVPNFIVKKLKSTDFMLPKVDELLA